MLNKRSIREYSLKATKTYDRHATVHRYIASSLIELIEKEQYHTVLEIGCGTGILTEMLKEKLEVQKLYLNDIAEFSHVTLLGDMDRIEFPRKCNLIISSSTLHWSEDVEKLIKKVYKSLKNNGEFIFSMFVDGNLVETDRFNSSVKYLSFDRMSEILSKRFNIKLSYTETIEKRFASPMEALREFKNLGIPKSGSTTIRDIRAFDETKLTYQTAYFVVRKEKKFSLSKISLKPLSALRFNKNKK